MKDSPLIASPPSQRLALWTSPVDGYSYFVVRLHDEDENRLKRIEQRLDTIEKQLNKLMEKLENVNFS